MGAALEFAVRDPRGFASRDFQALINAFMGGEGKHGELFILRSAISADAEESEVLHQSL
jgi:hypothetical protein